MLSQSTYQAVSDISLWSKVKDGDQLCWSDVPKIIPLRWTYLKNNWNFIRDGLLADAESTTEADYVRQQIDLFSRFIEIQRVASSKINPLESEEEIFKYHGIFSLLPVNITQTNRAEEEIIKTATDRVSIFNKKDFTDIRNILRDERDLIADVVGLSDDSYDSTYRRSASPEQLTVTLSHIAKMKMLQDVIDLVTAILANLSQEKEGGYIDPFAIARANANNDDIDIALNKSGYLVRLNYGESLQDLARRYLDNQDRWIDIAIANGLRAPYIDETGESILLISNANENRLNIAGLDTQGLSNIDKLYINQVILLQSSSERFPEQRTIRSIRQVPVSNEIVIEVDGDRDLSRYTIADLANIRIFKPNTINSNFYIMIPTEDSIDDTGNQELPFFMVGKKEDEKKAGIDLALDESGDIILTPTSDLQLSYGLANAVQAIKIKFITERGTLPQHTEFGLPNIAGTAMSFEDAKNALVSAINDMIQSDSRFDRIESLDVLQLPNSTAILVRLVVKMAGSTQNLPITFTVNR